MGGMLEHSDPHRTLRDTFQWQSINERKFRLEVSLHGRAWCRIDADMPWASEAVGDIISHLPKSAGYRVKIYVATEERCIVESGPEGV